MHLLAEDALAEFPMEKVSVTTPCGTCDGVKAMPLDRICAVSIVRSGDCLLEVVRRVEPCIKVGKILIQRDEDHPEKIASLFYSKLPEDAKDLHILLCDPMLATGGSALKALEVLTEKYGCDPAKIVFANMICCPEGLKALGEKYPMVKIVTVFVDPQLNEHKFIVPGLGDFGDRFFNT